jgi:hypothetical protein
MTKRDHTNAERQRRYIARLKARVTNTVAGEGVTNTLIEITEADGSRSTKPLEQFLRDLSYSQWLQSAYVVSLEQQVEELNDEADELVSDYNLLATADADPDRELIGAMSMSLA